MAVVLGTSSGFVTVAPTDDPVGGSTAVIDGASVVTKDTSPATAYRITEIGWYRSAGTNTANFEVGLYGESGGVAATRLFVDNTNSSNLASWIVVPVSWLISGNTAYWLAVQMDSHTGSSSIDIETAGGAGYDRMTTQTTLNDPYGGGAVTDADGLAAIYALWVPVPSGSVAFPVTFNRVETGKVGARSQVAFPTSLNRVVNGRRIALGQTTQAISFGRVVNGVRVGVGTVDFPVTLSVVSAGDVSGTGADFFGAASLPLTVSPIISGRAAVYAHPLIDSVDGTWTTQDGGTSLASTLDEHIISDADYIRSELHPVDSACRVRLEPLVNPDTDSWHHLDWRIAKDAGSGNTVNMEVRLYQGGGNNLGAGTLIASFTRLDVSETFTTYHEILTAGEAAAITNYADLYMEFEGTVA